MPTAEELNLNEGDEVRLGIYKQIEGKKKIIENKLQRLGALVEILGFDEQLGTRVKYLQDDKDNYHKKGKVQYIHREYEGFFRSN